MCVCVCVSNTDLGLSTVYVVTLYTADATCTFLITLFCSQFQAILDAFDSHYPDGLEPFHQQRPKADSAEVMIVSVAKRRKVKLFF